MMKNFFFLAAALSAALPAAGLEPQPGFDGAAAAAPAAAATLAGRLALSAGAPAPLAPRLPDKGGIPPVPPPYPAYPGGGQPGQPGQPANPNDLPPFGINTPFIAAVNINDGIGGNEAFSGTGGQVSFRFSKLILNNLFQGVLEYNVELDFPAGLNRAKVLAAIVELEKNVADGTVKMVQEQLKTLMPMGNASPAEKAKMLRIIAEDERVLAVWREDAREEALAYSNWRMTAPNKFVFRPGAALQQLNRSFLGREYLQGIFRSK